MFSKPNKEAFCATCVENKQLHLPWAF